MFPSQTLELARRVIETLAAREMTIATAESCTGGLIGGALTSVSGASAAVYGGFITYANEAKMAMLDVPLPILTSHGAVSEEVAWFMAVGAREAAGTDVGVAVTGIAGPGGGSKEKPVGLVHVAVAIVGETGFDVTHKKLLLGDIGREEVRMATVNGALELVLETATGQE